MDKLDKKTTDKVWKEIKDKPNVVGYSQSLKPKIKNGKVVDGKRVIRVYVSRKVPLSELSTQDVVPQIITNGQDNYDVDIIEIGEIKAQPDDGRQDRHRPLVIGPSAMGVWEGSTACSMGGLAINKKEGEPEFVGILANNHCAAHENKATKGTAYIQPSPYDGGSMPDDLVGRLWRYVPIIFNGYVCPFRNFAKKLWRVVVPTQTMDNKVDIAFVKLEDDIPYNNEVHTVGPMLGKKEAIEGERVEKFGRTTGLTTDGLIIDTDWTGRVRYSRGTVIFTDCYLISGNKFSQGGDSSSLTYTKEDRMYIGNLFAGSDTTSVVCKWKNIEEQLQVEVLI